MDAAVTKIPDLRDVPLTDLAAVSLEDAVQRVVVRKTQTVTLAGKFNSSI